MPTSGTEPPGIRLANVRTPWLGLWAVSAASLVLLLAAWGVSAPFEATSAIDLLSAIVILPLVMTVLSASSAVPLLELSRRRGRTPIAQYGVALLVPATLLALCWMGLFVDQRMALQGADARFATLLGAPPATSTQQCAGVDGPGVLLSCDGSTVHTSHASLPWSLRAHQAEEAAWVGTVCPVSLEPATFRSVGLLSTTSMKRQRAGVGVQVRDRRGVSLAGLALVPEVPKRVDSKVLAFKGGFAVAPWTMGREIGACLRQE